MKKRGMNARVQALRELSVTTQPHIDMERAKYWISVGAQPTEIVESLMNRQSKKESK